MVFQIQVIFFAFIACIRYNVFIFLWDARRTAENGSGYFGVDYGGSSNASVGKWLYAVWRAAFLLRPGASARTGGTACSVLNRHFLIDWQPGKNKVPVMTGVTAVQREAGHLSQGLRKVCAAFLPAGQLLDG